MRKALAAGVAVVVIVIAIALTISGMIMSQPGPSPVGNLGSGDSLSQSSQISSKEVAETHPQLVQLAPDSGLPYDYVRVSDISSADTDLGAILLTTKYASDIGALPTYLIIYRFENEQEAESSYDLAISKYREEFSKESDAEIRYNGQTSFYSYQVDEYDIIISDVLVRWYSWQDYREVFITIGPFVSDTDMSAELAKLVIDSTILTK